jgi:hypothetical protein
VATWAFAALNSLRDVGRAKCLARPRTASVTETWKVFDEVGEMKDNGIEERLLTVGPYYTILRP